MLDGLIFLLSRLHIVSVGGPSDSLIHQVFTAHWSTRLVRFFSIFCELCFDDHMVVAPFRIGMRGNLYLPGKSFLYDWKLQCLMD